MNQHCLKCSCEVLPTNSYALHEIWQWQTGMVSYTAFAMHHQVCAPVTYACDLTCQCHANFLKFNQSSFFFMRSITLTIPSNNKSCDLKLTRCTHVPTSYAILMMYLNGEESIILIVFVLVAAIQKDGYTIKVEHQAK